VRPTLVRFEQLENTPADKTVTNEGIAIEVSPELENALIPIDVKLSACDKFKFSDEQARNAPGPIDIRFSTGDIDVNAEQEINEFSPIV
jgi:hypothetical protein